MTVSDHTRQLEVLVEVAQLISTLDLDEVLQQTLKLTTEVIGASKGSFFLLDQEGRTLQRFIAARDMDTQRKTIVSNRVLEGGLAGWVIANRQVALVDDTNEDARWVKLDDEQRVRSALCIPFFVEGQVRGIMTLEHPEPHHFNKEDMRLAKAVANQAESALRNAQLFDRVTTQQREITAVMNSISEGLLAVDFDWTITLINPAAEALLAVEPGGAQGRRLDELALNSPFFNRISEIITTSNLRVGTKSFELRDEAARKDFVVNVTALHEDAFGRVGYAIALYDVTSLKDLTRLKTHMLKMASHDLKNPLGLMQGYVDLIWADVSSGVLPEPSYIESIYKAISRMEDLIATLLDAHRSEHPIQAASIDPYELIDSILEDLTPSALQRHQIVVRNFQPDLPEIKGDTVQIKEAITNLVGNASKYTPDGGTITVNMYTEGERFYFNVKDTGYGIPADQQKNIFQPYFRANQASTEHIKGTGVGLSLVKEVIERHGGQVWFLSHEGVGSTFGFWLPLLDPQKV